jgi:PTH2 family peptidyl-tRNA hydrolase
MSETHKQVLVMRKDLNCRKGKMIAQGAHASVAAILKGSVKWFMQRPEGQSEPLECICIPLTPDIRPWLEGKFTKICVSVDSEAELLAIHQKAKTANLITSLILDAGLTEFGGIPTYTACAVGPGPSAKIDEITGTLKLL